jgi:ATP-dependent Clp protease adapter protein ClpS
MPSGTVKSEMRSIATVPRAAVRTPVRPHTRPVEESNEQYTGTGSGFIVIVYDNDVNTYDQVIHILQQATGCTYEEAYVEAWEVDKLGKSVVHHGSRTECERAAGIIRQIGIRVEVTEE